jgi:hypothetical protein
MAYRDERACHICGEETHRVCPSCNNGVCIEHTMQRWLPDEQQLDADQRAAARRLAKRLGGVDACSQCVETEIAVTERAPMVAVLRTSDPMQAQMITETLLEEGLDARLFGTQNAALLGAGQYIFEQRVEVPETQAERALELIEACGGIQA